MSSQSLRDRARDYQDELPESWRPGEGEVLVGKVEGYDSVETSFGRCATCRVRDEDGTLRTVWLSSTTLLAAFHSKRPKVGEKIAIRRLADGHNKAGTEYKRFVVLSERDQAPDAGLDVLDRAAAEAGLAETKVERPELFTRDDAPDFSDEALSAPRDDLPF